MHLFLLGVDSRVEYTSDYENGHLYVHVFVYLPPSLQCSSALFRFKLFFSVRIKHAFFTLLVLVLPAERVVKKTGGKKNGRP